jgi:hypothetical protein
VTINIVVNAMLLTWCHYKLIRLINGSLVVKSSTRKVAALRSSMSDSAVTRDLAIYSQ